MSDNYGVTNTGSGGINIGNHNVFGYQPRVTHVTLTPSEQALLDSVREHVATDPVERKRDIFLSHATADLQSAQILQNALEKLGADVWIDDDSSLRHGRNFVRPSTVVSRSPALALCS
jgi:hypothetical protein